MMEKIQKVIKFMKRLNKKFVIVTSASLLLVIIAVFFFVSDWGISAFTTKETPPQCIDECSFEGKLCEDAKIYECVAGDLGCKVKRLVEECKEEAVCSEVKEGSCFEPQFCDGDFHMCISDVLYKICKNGKTVEGSETKRCPENLMCNRNPKNFAICIPKDY